METTVEWMKLIIKSIIWNIGKQKTTNQDNKKKKKNPKKQRKYKQPLGQLQEVQQLHDRGAREEKEQEIGNLFEKIMKEKFPNSVKELDMQVLEAQRVPNRMDAKRPTPRHIIIKMPKVRDKERIVKATREKQLLTYRGVPIRLSADFSKETLQARRYWQETFKVMKSRGLQPRLLYPAKLSFRIEGQIKSFPDKKKLKEFIITKPLLYEML